MKEIKNKEKKSFEKLPCCYGISSLTQDNQHIFMADSDGISFYTFRLEMKRIQAVYDLSDIFIIKSTHGFNAFSLDKLTLNLIYDIGINSRVMDRDFFVYGLPRGYFTLRMDQDKQLATILNCIVPNKFEKSNAHRLFTEWFFNLIIPPKKDHFDNNTKLDIIQYPSDKNGYHLQTMEANNDK